MKQHHHSSIALGPFLKNKIYAIINVGGVMIAVVIAIIIGFWLTDEISIKKAVQNNRVITIGKQPLIGEIQAQNTVPLQLAEELRISFGDKFQLVVLGTKKETELITKSDNEICRQEIAASTTMDY